MLVCYLHIYAPAHSFPLLCPQELNTLRLPLSCPPPPSYLHLAWPAMAPLAFPSSPIRRTHSAPRLRKGMRVSPPTEWSALVPSTQSSPDTSSGDEAVRIRPRHRGQFDCNICFDAAREPVVTQCGHLYCWQCLHQVISPPSSLTPLPLILAHPCTGIQGI